jgi:hypothetical protein
METSFACSPYLRPHEYPDEIGYAILNPQASLGNAGATAVPCGIAPTNNSGPDYYFHWEIY